MRTYKFFNLNDQSPAHKTRTLEQMKADLRRGYAPCRLSFSHGEAINSEIVVSTPLTGYIGFIMSSN